MCVFEVKIYKIFIEEIQQTEFHNGTKRMMNNKWKYINKYLYLRFTQIDCLFRIINNLNYTIGAIFAFNNLKWIYTGNLSIITPLIGLIWRDITSSNEPSFFFINNQFFFWNVKIFYWNRNTIWVVVKLWSIAREVLFSIRVQFGMKWQRLCGHCGKKYGSVWDAP